RINGNWLILRGFNITLKNMTSIGTFTAYEGQPRSLATISPDPNFSEANPNYGVYGADTVYLTDVKGYNAWGDSMTTGSSEYVDGSVGVYTKNLFIKRMHAKTAGRMCWGPTSGTNIWIEDSLCEDAWYGGLDAELDNVNQPLQGHHYLRNTFNGFNHFGISVPVAADNSVKSQDIEIRDNIFLTPTDTPQYPVFLIGLYPDNPNTFQNVVIEGNDIKHYCKGIALDHVSSGSVQNNKLTRVFKPGYTPEGICGAGNTDSVSSTNTQNVTFSNNGPDVVLNNTSSTPTPTPTPTPQPSPNPSPTPTNPPPAPSSCQAPANFTGSAGPPGSGRYDFTWSAMNGADGYYLYYATAPDQPATVYSGPFSANSASAFSLVMDRQYNFAVRSRCGSPESSNSNVINVVAPSSSSNTPPSRPSPSKTGDLNNDNKVNITDLSILLSKWNTNATNADLNNDGKVNVIDLSILLSHWG
ncbi:MAG TPA: dockerin type I repeat-containing protein, partial [Candidatus Limnocylindrales bacterium]|nr:dockerin type I repeat-containing protein [Candidatus Limnocylindrales bacterium]